MSEDTHTKSALKSLKDLVDLSAQARGLLAPKSGQTITYKSPFDSSDFYCLAKCVSTFVDTLIEQPLDDADVMERIRLNHSTLTRRLEDLTYTKGDLDTDGFLNDIWLARNRNNLFSYFSAASRLVNRPSGRLARGYASK